MTNNNVLNDVVGIVSKTFSIPVDSIQLDSGPEQISLWDSLGQLNLISNIEEHFAITLEYDELFEIISVKSIVDILERKLK